MTPEEAIVAIRQMASDDHAALGPFRALSGRAFAVVRKHGEPEDQAMLEAACEVLGETLAASKYDDEWVRLIGPIPTKPKSEESL